MIFFMESDEKINQLSNVQCEKDLLFKFQMMVNFELSRRDLKFEVFHS